MTPLTDHELKETQLRLLDVFVQQCKKHDLTFYLYYGSLIGAIRHNGMIPWDDDIDVAMPRKDYDELRFIDWADHDCTLMSPCCESGTPYLVTKLSDINTFLNDNIDGQIADLGVNIDIFPLDYFDKTELRARFYHRLAALLKLAHAVKYIRISNKRQLSKNATLAVGKTLLSFVPIKEIVRSVDGLSRNITQSKRMVSALGPYGAREIMQSDWLSTTIEIEFEHRLVPVPVGYDKILTSLYGNYMQLPPVEKRVTHHSFEAYRR